MYICRYIYMCIYFCILCTIFMSSALLLVHTTASLVCAHILYTHTHVDIVRSALLCAHTVAALVLRFLLIQTTNPAFFRASIRLSTASASS